MLLLPHESVTLIWHGLLICRPVYESINGLYGSGESEVEAMFIVHSTVKSDFVYHCLLSSVHVKVS